MAQAVNAKYRLTCICDSSSATTWILLYARQSRLSLIKNGPPPLLRGKTNSYFGKFSLLSQLLPLVTLFAVFFTQDTNPS